MKDLMSVDPVVTPFDRVNLRAALMDLRTRPDAPSATMIPWLEALIESEQRSPDAVDTRTAVNQAFRACLDHAGITQGRIAEIGGPFNSSADLFPEFEFEWLSLYPVEGRSDVRVCNICDADHLEGGQYDAIFSVSVMEHVAEPWRAAHHMRRLLKPGGIVFHAAPFSYFYHGAPDDYWRYTPDAFEALFPTFKPLMAEFYGASRRRDNRGSDTNPVAADGGPDFAVDAFGGWRENWSTIYCGQHCPDWARTLREATMRQIVVDLMRQYVLQGQKPHEAARHVSSGLRKLELSSNLRLRRKETGRGIFVKPSTCVSLYKDRDALGLAVSSNTHSNVAKFEHLLATPPIRHPLRTFCSKLVSKALR